MRLSHRDKFFLKTCLMMAAYVATYVGLSASGSLLGGNSGLLSVVPALLILRFLWSDVWSPDSSKSAATVAKWLFFPFLALIIWGAYIG
jgi:hypothetical protein